jgi:hypothetical protein
LYARKDEGTGDHAPLDDVLNICCKVPVAWMPDFDPTNGSSRYSCSYTHPNTQQRQIKYSLVKSSFSSLCQHVAKEIRKYFGFTTLFINSLISHEILFALLTIYTWCYMFFARSYDVIFQMLPVIIWHQTTFERLTPGARAASPCYMYMYWDIWANFVTLCRS